MRTGLCASTRRRRRHASSGFSIIEVSIVMVVGLILAAVTIPGYLSMMRYLRITGDIRDLNGATAGAKMRAAQDFTHARLRANLAANTFQVEVWDKAPGANCWKTDGEGVNRCTAADSPTQPLSTGVSFGFSGVGAGNPNPQAAIAQAPACITGVAGTAPGATIANTACVEFNSRGVPVASNGSPTATDALYVTDTNRVYGVTVIISGLAQVWSTDAKYTAWQAR